MMFQLEVKVEKTTYRFTVVPLGEYNEWDRYMIRGGNKELIMANNRPELKAKNLRHTPQWYIEGRESPRYNPDIYTVGRAIEQYMRDNGHWQ